MCNTREARKTDRTRNIFTPENITIISLNVVLDIDDDGDDYDDVGEKVEDGDEGDEEAGKEEVVYWAIYPSLKNTIFSGKYGLQSLRHISIQMPVFDIPYFVKFFVFFLFHACFYVFALLNW